MSIQGSLLLDLKNIKNIKKPFLFKKKKKIAKESD